MDTDTARVLLSVFIGRLLGEHHHFSLPSYVSIIDY